MNAADVFALVDDVAYTEFPGAAGSAPTTVCRLVVRGGHVLIGSSTPARADNFDSGIGRRMALDAATRALVECERYHRRRVAEAPA